MEETERAFQALYENVARLRGPGGCPWDHEQTPRSLRGDLIEETFECVEAIDENQPAHIKEELGDLFLLVTMISYMHEQAGSFSVADVLHTISEKVIRRHPHVFAGLRVKDSAEVLEHWARIKVEEEGRKPKDSILDEVSKGLPPLERAYKLQKKAAKAGFDWTAAEDVAAKVEEELGETRQVLKEGGEQKKLEEELGDLLFSVVNLCRFLGFDPAVALQGTNNKFVRRFKRVEARMREQGLTMTGESLPLMEGFWEEAKQAPCSFTAP